MQPRSLKIRQRNIVNAVRKDSRRCMIANAVQEQVPGARFISVDAQSIRFSDTKKGRRYIYLTPHRAQRALIEWDGGKDVRPFTLNMSQGYERQMRVRAPGYRPKKRNRKLEQKTRRQMPPYTRVLGLRHGTA